MKLYDGDFPVLKSHRLVLRKPGLQDVKFLFQLRTDPVVNKFIDRNPPRSLDEVVSFIEKITAAVNAQDSFYWVIECDNTIVGTICLWNFNSNKTACEVGFELASALHGNGLMTEALTEVMVYAQSFLKLEKIEAYTHKENTASIKLLLKAGLVADELRQTPENKDLLLFYRVLN